MVVTCWPRQSLPKGYVKIVNNLSGLALYGAFLKEFLSNGTK